MPSVFPTLGAFPTVEDGYKENLRIYHDAGYRRYLQSDFNHRVLTLTFKGISQALKESIVSFWQSRLTSTADFEFYIYHPEETAVLDLSGAETTGRHLAIFTEQELEFTRSGRCRWSGQTRVLLLN